MNYNIAYLTSKNPLDKNASSGVYFYQSRILARIMGKLDFVGPVNNFCINLITRISNFSQRFFIKNFKPSHNLLSSKIYGRVFSAKLKNKKFDLIFADKASCEIAYLKTDTPIIYSTDGTFASLNEYYPNFSNLSKVSEIHGNLIEQKAIDRASLVICATQWAANSVINDYKCNPSKVFVVPRGANIDELPERKAIEKNKKSSVCKLLFVGIDWKRKGFDIAFQTLKYIRSQGVAVKLTAIGNIPNNEFEDNDLQIIPYIDKSKPEDYKIFQDLMLNSDFLFIPTRAECMGITFCESSAYGLPVITTDTGGVSEVIINGINGFTLPYESSYKDYGNKIISIFSSGQAYYELRKTSRDYYEKKLNWDHWANSVKYIVETHLKLEEVQYN